MGNFMIPTDGLKEKFDKAYIDLRKSVKRPNILLLGQTGVGKSSLVNTIFGKNVAAVSHIKSETKGFRNYSDAHSSVNIIDSEGYELAKPDEFKRALSQYIEKNFADVARQIHIAWYCISLSSARVLPYDLDNMEYLYCERKIPTCVVFTQCDNDSPDGATARALEKVVTDRFGRHIPCFQTSNDRELNAELDLDKLSQWSLNNLNDDNLRLGFLVAQRADLVLKDDRARKRVKYYAGGAAAIGGSPIPMSDAVLLTGLQVQMASDIFSIYGLDVRVTDTLKNVIGGNVVSVIGRTIAGNLLKLVPGYGTAAGAAINATVASSITYSLGYAICRLTRKAIENEWNGDIQTFEKIFSKENIQHYIDEYTKSKK